MCGWSTRYIKSSRKIQFNSTYACFANDCDFSSPRLVMLPLTTKVAPLKITKILLILNKKFKLFRIIFRIIIPYVFPPRKVSTNTLYIENWPGELIGKISMCETCGKTMTRQKFWTISKIERTKVGNFLW